MSNTTLLRRTAIACCAALLLVAAPAAAQPGEHPRLERPALLVPLYVSFAGLQAIDAHSTFNALDVGGREGNPVVRGVLGTPAGLFALKAGAALTVVYMTEKLWRKNRTAAIVGMVAINSAYAMIAAHNYRVAQGLER
ncbi:MAG: DUF5658 family protein [Vicinamibacterales bacterium]